MMKLYHGSNMKVDKPDLSRSKTYKDFGQGFYLSAEEQQAKELAQSKVDQMKSGEPIVSEFLFDEKLMTSGDLHVKIFDDITFQYFFGTERALKTLNAL